MIEGDYASYELMKKAPILGLTFDDGFFEGLPSYILNLEDTEYSQNNSWNFNCNSNNCNLNWNNKNNYNDNNRVRDSSFSMTLELDKYFLAYKDCRKHKRRTINQLKFEIDYEYYLVKLHYDVNHKVYKLGRSIRFPVTRPKLREVFAACFRDRVIHHLIILEMNPLIEQALLPTIYNCRKNKGVLYGAKNLAERIRTISNNYTYDCYVGTWDLSGFFMSIDKQILWEKLSYFLKENYSKPYLNLVLYLTKLIVMARPLFNCRTRGIKILNRLPKNKSLITIGYNKGLPIGNLPSLIWASFYLNEFDHYIYTLYGDYGRYVDDFNIVSIKPLNEVAKQAEEFLNNLLLKLNKNKVYIQSYYLGVKFVGYVIKRNRIYMKNTTINTLNKKIYKMKESINPQVINSYLGFLVHTNSFNIRKNIINTLPDVKTNFNCTKIKLL